MAADNAVRPAILICDSRSHPTTRRSWGDFRFETDKLARKRGETITVDVAPPGLKRSRSRIGRFKQWPEFCDSQTMDSELIVRRPSYEFKSRRHSRVANRVE